MKVLLIDDHPLILSALRAVIEGLGERVVVVAVETARAARETLEADADFDLVLLDLKLGDADGFEVLIEFRTAYPAVPVVVVSASERPTDVLRSIDLGAMGFVPKRASNQLLFDALHMVMSGGVFVPIMALGMEGFEAVGLMPGDLFRGSGEAVESRTLEGLGLTPRQSEVLVLLLQGKPNKIIARDLELSVETVKDHVAAVLRALNVSSRTQAVLAVGQMSEQFGTTLSGRKA